MKYIIVTGATGFIGSWLVKNLLDKGIHTTVIVRNKQKLSPEICEKKNCTIIQKDINDISQEDFPLRGYDAFIHLAWAGVETENKNNIPMQLNNIQMSLKAIEVASSIGCKKFIASGSVAEYVFCNDIMDLKAKQTPNDMYGVSKVSTHYFLEVRARQIGIPFIWMVISSTYGPGRIGNNIITYTIETLLKQEKPLFGSLRQMWDFLYIEDVIEAIILIAEKGKADKVYGIGSGRYRSLREYIEDIRDVINPELPLGIGELPSMDNQTFSSCVNSYELIADTGFYPKIDFIDGIKRTVEYMVFGNEENEK